MKKHSTLIKIGIAAIGIALLALLINFYNLYTLVGNCPIDIDAPSINTQACQSLESWYRFNYFAAATLVIGIGLVIIGLINQHRNKK